MRIRVRGPKCAHHQKAGGQVPRPDHGFGQQRATKALAVVGPQQAHAGNLDCSGTRPFQGGKADHFGARPDRYNGQARSLGHIAIDCIRQAEPIGQILQHATYQFRIAHLMAGDGSPLARQAKAYPCRHGADTIECVPKRSLTMPKPSDQKVGT